MNEQAEGLKRRGMHGGIGSYVTGFVLSIGMTVVSFILVASHLLTSLGTLVVIVTLAALQIIVQLFFFLHLGRESKPRWNIYILLFALMVVIIIIGGSLWIMHNLDRYMIMTPEQINTYMHNNEGL